MSEPTPEEVVEALRKSGWLLEQDTYGLLRHHGFNARMGRAFQDLDDPAVSREVDVWAFRELHRDPAIRYSVGCHIVAECKVSNAPFVAIGRPLEPRDRFLPSTEHVLPCRTVHVPFDDGRQGYREVPAWSHFAMHALPGSPSSEEFRATQLTRLERRKTWTAENRGIFNDLVFPLAKAVRALQKEHPQRPNRAEYDRKFEWASFSLMFPIVVTTAPLFFIDATAPTLEPQKVRWVQTSRELRTNSVAGHFLIDVVQYQHLGDFVLNRVLQFADAVRDRVVADPDPFLRIQQ